MKKYLKLLSNLIYIDTILKEMNRNSLDTKDTNFETITSTLLKNSTYEDFLNLLNQDDYKTFINGTIPEKILIYKKTKDKLNEALRYDLLNYNIEQELNKILEYNPFAYQNLEKIILCSIKSASKYNSYQGKNNISFPIGKTINITKEYLKEIDKSYCLYNLFQQKLLDGSILLWEINNKNEELKMRQLHRELALDTKSWKVFYEDNKIYINAPYDNTILDIYRLVHEFIHLCIYNNKENILEATDTEIFFEEFPSIYYENVLKNYLIRMGFPENIAEIAIKERENTYINYVYSLIALSNLIKVKQHHAITQSDLNIMYNINILKDEIKKLNKTEKEQYYQEMKKCGINLENAEETANNICDSINSTTISYEYTKYKTINYIIATLLTEHINKKIDNNDTLKDKILFITKTLGTTEQEPEEVLEFLECADLFDAIPNTIKPAPKNNIKLYKYQ